MKYFFPLGLFFLSIALFSCKTTRQINKAIAPKDSTTVFDKKSSEDSLKLINETVNAFKANYIDFKTFSAKISTQNAETRRRDDHQRSVDGYGPHSRCQRGDADFPQGENRRLRGSGKPHARHRRAHPQRRHS